MINHWTFRCKDVSALVSQGLDTRLPLTKRIGIRFHLMMCHLCREYKRQLTLIHRVLKRLDPPEVETTDLVPLPEGVKNRILEQMPPEAETPSPRNS